eukprot:9475161-Pyramimonas_sp.AAC.1
MTTWSTLIWRRARGSEKEKVFSEGGGTSHAPSRLLGKLPWRRAQPLRNAGQESLGRFEEKAAT